MSKQEMTEKSQQTALADLRSQLRKEVEAQAEVSEQVAGNQVKASHTGFSVPDIGDDIPAPLDVVILGFVSRKEYYDKPYIQGEIHPPACAAVGPGTFDTLVPQEDALDKQADSCSECPLNEFGTSQTGKGKKCADKKVVAFMLPDAKPDDPIYTASISPSGLKEFNSFLGRLNKRYQLPAIAFVSELGIKPAGASVSITVKEKEPLMSQEDLQKFMARKEEAMETLLAPINFNL